MGAPSQRKGAETFPWPRSRTHSATWLRGQHSRGGPEAGSGEHHFLEGRGQRERERCPIGEARRGYLPQGSELDIGPEQAAARKT